MEKFKDKYDVHLIQQRIKSIEEAVEDGLFSSSRIKDIPKYPKNPKEIKSELESGMAIITLEVTEQCNLRCRYCVYSDQYYYTRKHSTKSMSFDVAQKAIDYYLAHSADSKLIKGNVVGFYGGEPLANFELIKQCIEYIKTKVPPESITYNMTTNGTLLDDDMIDYFAANQVHMLVSIDGPGDIHDRNRVYANGRGSYDKLVRNLMRVKQRYPEYYEKKVNFIAIVSPPYDYGRLDTYFSSFELFKNHWIRFNGVTRANTSYYDNFEESELRDDKGIQKLLKKYIDAHTIKLSEPQMSNKLALARHVANEDMIRLIYLRPMFRLPEKWYPAAVCIPGITRCFVTVDGRFFPCERGNTNNETLCIGNVESGIQLDRVLRLIEHATEIFQDICIDCWACRFCSTCYVLMEGKYDFCVEQTQKVCHENKRMLHHALELFCSIL